MSRARHKRILKRQKQARRWECAMGSFEALAPVVWVSSVKDAIALSKRHAQNYGTWDYATYFASQGGALTDPGDPDMPGLTHRELLP